MFFIKIFKPDKNMKNVEPTYAARPMLRAECFFSNNIVLPSYNEIFYT